VQAWLELPHVQAAFGDSDEWLAEISSNLTSDWIRRFRADLVGIPAGFVQYYDTTRAPKGAWSSQPRGSFGIDFFLGDPALLRHGHGTRLVEQLAQFVELAVHPTRLIVDPETWNLASIRIARATGFVLDPPTGLWIKEFGRG
jgi:aminoglycoside 6'-N-acetyltransferase